MKLCHGQHILRFSILAFFVSGVLPLCAQVKWQPGHYDLIGWKEAPSRWSVIATNRYWQGGQRLYLWKHLEPEEGKYDFSRVEEDIAYLKQHGKYLVIEVWDNMFFGKKRAVPDYLVSDPVYEGGIVYRRGKRKDGSGRGTVAKRWVPAVMDRYIALLEELGKRYDAEPCVAGLVHTETSIGLGKGGESYTSEKFMTQMNRLVSASRKAFPTTPVIVYGNWWPKGGVVQLRQLAEQCYRHGVGWGGPDICPGNKGHGYQIHPEYKGKMAFGVAAQWQSYDGRWTAEEILKYGLNELHLNFFFWNDVERRDSGGISFRQDVIPVVARYKGRVHTARPENLSMPPVK